jgi:signal transduction histidine kinase
LTNAVNHADARRIRVFLMNDDLELRLEISDDGIGISRGEGANPGVGLQIMRHRANLIGASLEIDTRAGKGTSVICRLPYPTGKT